MADNSKYVFFLGGNDLEMSEIRNILNDKGIEFHDKNLGWGARAAPYEAEIAQVANSGKIPVLIELNNEPKKDYNGNEPKTISLPNNTIDIDHHDQRASEDPSLIQVLNLLELEPTREQKLI